MDLSQDEKLRFFQEHIGYSDEEMAKFQQNPKFVDIIERALSLNQWTVVAEVVKSAGCNSKHVVGTKFFFDPFGNMLTKLNPSRVCIFALAPLQMALFHIGESLYGGHNPQEMAFKRASCFDVGLECGGWGQIVMEVNVIPRSEVSSRK